MRIDDTTTLRRNPSALGTSTGDTMVLLDERGEYLELNPVGVSVWECLEQPTTFGALVLLLATEYGAAAAQVRGDVLPFLDELAERGLVLLT
ncbi:PqqD family protein [Nocardioides zeae]|uniref:PqqD family protein n=1 Tax=Nocardioides zeae TaxID=1457234 RepID=A0AAJ1WZQ6_9ACTN|nr:PqqD family protein [Nocardioides zeae]MDQ1102966.1 hypothetical protein [Nocardioides zeae]